MEVNLTASVGVCVYPDFAEDVDSLLERADAATYAAKEDGRNQFQVFSDGMLKESQDRLSMDTALRHALGPRGAVPALSAAGLADHGPRDRNGIAAALAPSEAGRDLALDLYSAG